MTRRIAALALLAVVTTTACSDGGRQSQSPQPGGGASGPGTGTPPPTTFYQSHHYLGPFSGSLPEAGTVEVDYRGCDGLVVVGTGLCVALLIDGDFVMVDTVDRGEIIEFLYDRTAGNTWVDVQHAVIGPVSNIDSAHARLTVLDQIAHVTDLTAWYGLAAQNGIADIDDLAIGDDVTISGYFSADGEIIATLIQRNVEPRPLLLRGILASAANDAFHIGKLELDLSGAIFDGFPGGTPLAGDAVLLSGDEEPQGGVLAVRTARYATRDYQPTNTHLLNGFVTAVRQNWDFDIGGHRFQSYGCDACDALDEAGRQLAKGTFVRVFKNSVADLSLSWTTGDTTGIVGTVEALDADVGSLTVLGFGVQASPATYVGATDPPWINTDKIDLADLAIGDTVTVAGGILGDRIVADRITRDGAGARIRMMDFVLADPALIFMGRSIETNASTAVINCGYYDDACTAADLTWLFGTGETPPVMLIVDVQVAGTQLQATQITAFLE